MISAIGNRSFLMKTLLCVFCLLLLTASPAAAFWQQTFESHPNDISMSLISYDSYYINLASYENGIAFCGTGYLTKISMPFSGYLAFVTKSSSSYSVRLTLFDTVNYEYIYDDSPYLSAGLHLIEIVENAGKTGYIMYSDGVVVRTGVYKTHGTPNKIGITLIGSNIYLDNIHAYSMRGLVACDGLCSSFDTGQYYSIAAPYETLNSTNYYYINVYSPSGKKVYTRNFNTSMSELLVSNLIPVASLTEVGDYTIHLYHSHGSSNSFLTMTTFEMSDPYHVGSGTIDLDKTDYEAGETVKVWTHLYSYTPGYKVKCEFDTGGSNFRKEYDVVNDTQLGSFTIPKLSNVIGSHTIYLLDPDGNVADSVEMNVYVSGLPDISLDRESYSRTDKANLFYKDVKPGSSITAIFRYGGSTAQTVVYSNLQGSGTITLSLGNFAAADSIYVQLKDSSGYTQDNDKASIMVGNFVITGRVYDARTSAVIPGAVVLIQGNTTTSDISGNYNLTSLSGFANYSVSASGYTTSSGTVAVFDLETLHNFYLSPIIVNGGTGVYGTVVSSKTDYPLVGASVEVTNNDNLKRFSTIVDNKGYYSLSNNDLAGNLTVRVSYNNYDSIVATATVILGSMQNHNFRLNAVTGYEEIDPSEHTGGQDSDDPGETAEEKAYREKYGEMGKHPFDFNGDGIVENSEWKYAGERFIMLIGILAFMGFLMLINRRR